MSRCFDCIWLGPADLKRRQEELERLEAARRERIEAMRRQGEDRMRNVIAAPVSQATFVAGLFPGGFPRMVDLFCSPIR